MKHAWTFLFATLLATPLWCTAHAETELENLLQHANTKTQEGLNFSAALRKRIKAMEDDLEKQKKKFEEVVACNNKLKVTDGNHGCYKAGVKNMVGAISIPQPSKFEVVADTAEYLSGKPHLNPVFLVNANVNYRKGTLKLELTHSDTKTLAYSKTVGWGKKKRINATCQHVIETHSIKCWGYSKNTGVRATFTNPRIVWKEVVLVPVDEKQTPPDTVPPVEGGGAYGFFPW